MWRTVFEGGGPEATAAIVRADLAVSPCLASLVPANLDILQRYAGPPTLPDFALKRYTPRQASGAIAGLGQLIRDALARGRRTAHRRRERAEPGPHHLFAVQRSASLI